MRTLKRLLRQAIAVVGLAAVALALLPSPAAADNHRKDKVTVCGYSEDSDGQKYQMRYVNRSDDPNNPDWVCTDSYQDANGEWVNGVWPINTPTPPTPPTIKSVFGSAPSNPVGGLKNWCISKMFQSAHLIPQTGTHADGTSTNTVFFDHRNSNKKQTHREDDPVVDLSDLVAGAAFCSLKLF